MDYTNLFKFKFVDRERARLTFEQFLIEPQGNVLWIDGYKGVGKTSLVRYVLEQHPQFAFCYIDIKSFGTEQELISAFIEKIQSISKKKFLYSAQKNFKALYQKDSGNIINLATDRFPKITALVALLLDIGYYALTYKEDRTDAREIVVKYIRDVICDKPIFACIDNFSQCSAKSRDFFSYIIKSCITEAQFKCCIITNSDEPNWEITQRQIITEYPYIPIHLSGLEKAEYFYEILHLIFQMDSFSEHDISSIFNKCKGNPYSLSTVIYKLIEQDGIISHACSKPEIEKNVLYKIIREEKIELNDKDFSAIEKWVLFSYFSIGRKVSLHALKELANYIAQENILFTSFKDDKIGETILSLIERNILCIEGDFIEARSNHVFDSIGEIFEHSRIRDVFSYYAFKFFSLHPEFHESECQKCYHSYIARLPKWENINFEYGKSLFNQHHYDAASAIFYRLSDSNYQLEVNQNLLIGKCYYESGYYSRTLTQLAKINPDAFMNSADRIEYCILLGKSYNTTGNMIKACENLEMARKEVIVGSKQYVELLNLLQMYYCEMPGERSRAEEYFNEIRYNYKELYPVLWANTMRGCQNFVSAEVALSILKEAKKTVTDPLDKAFIRNTEGFVHIRLNHFNIAKRLFHMASESIMKLKPHEYSYAANNLAICYMLQGDYAVAKRILIKALLWNNTVYGSIVIKVHLMIVTCYLQEIEECNSYIEDITGYIITMKPRDETILRKLHVNLAIVNKILGNLAEMTSHLDNARKYVSGTSSQRRYDFLCKGKEGDSSMYTETTKFDPWFLIYAHD